MSLVDFDVAREIGQSQHGEMCGQLCEGLIVDYHLNFLGVDHILSLLKRFSAEQKYLSALLSDESLLCEPNLCRSSSLGEGAVRGAECFLTK